MATADDSHPTALPSNGAAGNVPRNFVEASLRAPVVGPIVFVACLAILIIGLRYSAGPLARWYAQRLKAAEGTKVELAEFSETPPQRHV
jgi:hypothetical protein